MAWADVTYRVVSIDLAMIERSERRIESAGRLNQFIHILVYVDCHVDCITIRAETNSG